MEANEKFVLSQNPLSPEVGKSTLLPERKQSIGRI
jgi:hypothetical protein